MTTITDQQAERFKVLRHEHHKEIFLAVQRELDRGSMSAVRAVLKQEQSAESKLAQCIVKHAEKLLSNGATA